jgi:hypothetical protein
MIKTRSQKSRDTVPLKKERIIEAAEAGAEKGEKKGGRYYSK